MDRKRVFFALEAQAQWPEKFPPGRLLAEPVRHMTLVFIGETDFELLSPLLTQIPSFPSTLEVIGCFRCPRFLPKESRPHVAAWEVDLMYNQQWVTDYVVELQKWLWEHNILKKKEERPFLAHVTLCRQPVGIVAWKNLFRASPVAFTHLTLYESRGNLHYEPLNVAHLPGIVGYSIAMPDIHWGYGFPIGGVAAMDCEEGVISPGGVGYDINCGVRLAIVPIPFATLSSEKKSKSSKPSKKLA